MQSESGPAPRHRRSPRGVDARRPSRGSARRGYGIRAPGTEREPGTASSAAPGPAQHQVSAARWIASRKLPNRRRIVFSDGRMPASVQLSAVGSEPCSATNLRRAATDSAIRVSPTSDSGTASPSNTPGGFALWELRSTTTTSGIHQARSGFAVRRGLRRRLLRGLRRDHGSLINIGFAFNPLNLLPMLISTVVIATPASVIPPSARHGYGWQKHSATSEPRWALSRALFREAGQSVP